MVRGFLAGLTAVATFFFVYWMGAGLLFGLLSLVLPPGPATVIGSLVAGVAGAGCGVLARRQLLRRRATGASPGLGWAVAQGALLLGAIGFVAGFFGPMIFTPGANQGPMLGIFITGPGGAVLGAVGGAIWWIARDRRGTPPQRR